MEAQKSFKLRSYISHKYIVVVMTLVIGRVDNLYRKGKYMVSVVRGREVERRPRNLEVPISIPGSGCQQWDFFQWPTHSARVLV